MKLCTLATLTLILLFGQQAFAACTTDDKEYASFWENYYEPDEAYAFGVEIQHLVRQKDLVGLLRLMDGEDIPVKKDTLMARKFDEHFSQEWIAAVLSESTCKPTGWRGFMLGRGNIWFNKKDDMWQITAINYPKEQLPSPRFTSGWQYEGETLHPVCFVPSFTASNRPVQLQKCLEMNTKSITITDGTVRAENTQGEYFTYNINKQISIQECKGLAADIEGTCLQSYLVESTYNGGGTQTLANATIYGLIELKDDKEKWLMPLKVVQRQ